MSNVYPHVNFEGIYSVKFLNNCAVDFEPYTYITNTPYCVNRMCKFHTSPIVYGHYPKKTWFIIFTFTICTLLLWPFPLCIRTFSL